MADWKPFHGWMAFENLDQGLGLMKAFTIGYRFTDDRSEEWTKRFNRFKDAECKALRGGAKLMGSAVPQLVSRLGLDTPRTVFIPALSSHEMIASDDGVLWRLTRYCAKATNVRFVGDAISKKAHDPLHKLHKYGTTGRNRRREILDAAEFRSRRIGKTDDILIFDDFITTGSTLSHIAQAVLETNPQINVYGICLGKAERLAYHRDKFGLEVSNNHVPAKWLRKWNEGEAG